MSAPIEARGAPFDQGLAQGLALRESIQRTRRALRSRYGFLAWRGARQRAHARCGQPMQRFLPQMHERLRGIADGARVGARVLELCEGMQHVQGVGSAKGPLLEGRLEIPPELEPSLALRRSAPDAVGFRSIELTSGPWTGCLAGVNEEGLAVLVIEDRGARGPSLRSYAQDLLLRAEKAEVAATHLRLRARYAGGDGALLVVDPNGDALRLELGDGSLSVSDAPHAGAPVAQSTVCLDAAARRLSWGGQRETVGSG